MIKLPLQWQGLYNIKKVRDGKVLQEENTHNLVCNTLAKQFVTLQSYTWWQRCVLGSGANVPAATDTQLTSRLWGVNYTSCEIENTSADRLSRTWKVVYVFPANSSYVGTIREVGLTHYSDTQEIVTHALIVDSEGNPISITKTYLDEIIVTVRITITRQSWTNGFTWAFETGALAQQEPKNLLTPRGGVGYGSSITLTPSFIPDYRPLSACRATTMSTDITYANGTTYASAEFSRDALETLVEDGYGSTAARGSVFTDYINSLCYGPMTAGTWNIAGVCHTPAIRIFLPNSSIFPVRTLSGNALGTGDGTTTDFAPAIPAWLENTEKVYVNGVLQTRGVDYQVDNLANLNKSCSVMLGNFAVEVDAERINGIYAYIWAANSGAPLTHGTAGNDAPAVSKYQPMIIKYATSYAFSDKVNYYALGKWRAPGKILAGASLVFYYSRDDAETWTEFHRITLTTDGGNNETFFADSHMEGRTEVFDEHTMPTVTGITHTKITLEDTDTELRVFFWAPTKQGRFGYVGDYAIRFTNPPAAGAVLTMDCNIDRPWKSNENNIQWNPIINFGF